LQLACLCLRMDVAKFLVSRGAKTNNVYLTPEFRGWLEKVRMMEALMSARVERVGAGSSLALLKYKDLFKHLTSFLYDLF
jgi:hypothetical protein